MTAAFLYCGGYRLRISSMSLLFCSVNLKGMFALFSGVSRCCLGTLLETLKLQRGVGRTHDEDGIARRSRAGGECSALRSRSYAGWPKGAPEHEGGDF